MPEPDANAAAAYEALAKTYSPELEGEMPLNSLYERPAVLSMLPDVAGKRVLDVGCGTGPISAWVTERGGQAVGFDITSSMIEIARQRGIPGAEFHVADLSQPLDFLEGEEFDIAVASLAFHYLRDWVAPLRELRRVLRPEGTLVISTHHPAWDIQLSPGGNYFDVELLHDRWTRAGGEFDVQFWRRPLSAMFSAFDEAGFSVISFLEPMPLPETRERFPETWALLTTSPVFAFFRLEPAS